MVPPIDIPGAADFTLRNATVPTCLVDDLPADVSSDDDELARLDIDIADGRIISLRPARGGEPAPGGVDLDSSMVWPCFVDVHTHIDLSLIHI